MREREREKELFAVFSGKAGMLYIPLVKAVLNWRDFPGSYLLTKSNLPILQSLANPPCIFLEGKVMCAFCIPTSRYQ